ncbi:MAG TPA: T9SS type A sorting domain-containing protein, partial [Candidatus Nanoperiomorbaceae bacterium]|nr:T9SS type A sorting domain-containing protein [Candidatus Nanoperiomorbaceae bacterium]
MKTISFLISAWAIVGLVQAQQYDYNWFLGYDYDLSIEGIEGSYMNFHETPPVISPIVLGGIMGPSSAVISDSLGVLQFYTDGCHIYNPAHQIMENGDTINPGEVFDIQCDSDALGYTAGTQSCLILPDPGHARRYYLFHKHISYVYDSIFDVVSDTLFYSLVDMSFNGGLGRVVEKNVPLLWTPLTYGQLTAVKHANGRDWWIVNGGDQNNTYYKFLLDAEGVQTIPFQVIGNEASFNGSGGGQACFSPDGRYYARHSAPDGVFLFDFDRQTGMFSNFQHLMAPTQSFRAGIAFSPSSRFLYACTRDTIYQFDLEAPDIGHSRMVVAAFDGFQDFFNVTFFNAQLAPDCKIYINSFSGVSYLHVIHQPDDPGLDCQVEQHAVQLPYRYARGMPFYPNYRLGPLVSGQVPDPPCYGQVDMTSTEETAPAPHAPMEVRLYPNPARDVVVLEWPQPLEQEVAVSVYDLYGRLRLEKRLEAGKNTLVLETTSLENGVFFVHL